MRKGARALNSIVLVLILGAFGIALYKNTGGVRTLAENGLRGAVSAVQSLLDPSGSGAGASSAAPGSASAASSSGGGQPLPVGGKITETPPGEQGGAAALPKDYFVATRVSGLSVYEYGRSLLNAKEQAVYRQVTQGVENVDSKITVQTDLSPTVMEKIYQYIISDHAEFFYVGNVSMSYSYSQVLGNTVYKSYTYQIQYDYSKSAVESMRGAMSAGAQTLLAAASGKTTDYKKELALHDALVNASTYDVKAIENPDAYPASFSAYGIFVNKKAVCEGYAKALKLLLDSAGVPSLYVSGTATSGGGETGAHAWNLADVGGKWLYLDATFDDPLYVNAKGQYVDYNKPDYTYFNFAARSDHQLGTFQAADPFSQSSENYETMPQT